MSGHSARTSDAAPQSANGTSVGQSTRTTGQPAANENIAEQSTSTTGQQPSEDAAAQLSANGTTGQPTDAATTGIPFYKWAITTIGLAAMMMVGRTTQPTSTVEQMAGGAAQSPGTGGQSSASNVGESADALLGQSPGSNEPLVASKVGESADALSGKSSGTKEPLITRVDSPHSPGRPADESMTEPIDNVGESAGGMRPPATTMEQPVDTEVEPFEASTQSTNTKGLSVPYFTLVFCGFSFPCGNKKNIEVLRTQMNDLKKVRFVMKLLLYEIKNSKDYFEPTLRFAGIKEHVNNLNKTISNVENFLHITPPVRKYGYGLGIKITRKVPETLEKLLKEVERYSDPASFINAPVTLATKEFMDALESEKISLIRVRGGSLGLTHSELTQICARAQEKNPFDDLALATVSQDPKSYLYKLQADLAEMLSLDLNQEKDISKRAELLLKRMNRSGRILIILEGVSVNINLEEVGIPVSIRCKVVMTLRNQHAYGKQKAEESNNDAGQKVPDKQAVNFMEPNWVQNLDKNSVAGVLVDTYKERDIDQLVANVEDWINSYKESVRTIYIKELRGG